MREGYEGYDPDGVGVANGNFMGLPRVADAAVDVWGVAFAPTVSYGDGTAGGPANVLAASYQLDVCLPGLERPWELGYDWYDVDAPQIAAQTSLREGAARRIAKLEAGQALDAADRAAAAALDEAGALLAIWLDGELAGSRERGRLPVVVGGSHAVALGAYYGLPRDCAILQIDAHMDLRVAYEGFRYSHASVMHNALDERPDLRLVQVGIRDYSPGEARRARDDDRVATFFDADLQRAALRGEAFAKTCRPIVDALPGRVWVSLDVDGLYPALCAHTGTPVPGGLSVAQVRFLVEAVLASGREIVGLDVVEVAGAPHEYEGAVAARLAYEISARAVLAQRGEE